MAACIVLVVHSYNKVYMGACIVLVEHRYIWEPVLCAGIGQLFSVMIILTAICTCTFVSTHLRASWN